MIAMSIAVPFIIIILVIVLAVIWMIKRFVSNTLQKLEWLESYNRGAINTKLSSIIDGLMTVRIIDLKTKGNMVQRGNWIPML